MEVNGFVVIGGQASVPSSFYDGFTPTFAKPACLSVALQALWTNRVPMHEPWPRVMKGDTTPPPNSKNDEYNRNVHHYDQYDNQTSPDGLKPIGVTEGDEDIARKQFWRR